MTTLISKATGLLTGAATFAAVDAINLVRSNHNFSISAAATVTSATFTVTNGAVIDGVLLFLKQFDGTTPSGTFKVDLQKGGVSQASVTVNKSDIPSNPSAASSLYNHPIFFKFTGTATGDGGSNWTLVLTTTGSGGIYYSTATASSTNLSRVLRRTTSATPAAGDDLYICGELTGAGTNNPLTVTMDSTAATAYGNGAVNSTSVNGGNISIGARGTLSYGTSTGTNYILRIAGDLIVGGFGTLNIGSAGAEIPRDSTAVLEFQPVSADTDFGLICRDYATVNIAGLSRTSGKNVTKCKLTSDITTSNFISVTGVSNGGANLTGIGPDGVSTLANVFIDNTNNAVHGYGYSGSFTGLPANTVVTGSVWLARGTGTTNRYVRVQLGNAAAPASMTTGVYADVDLQAGTIGTATAYGTGVATSASITAVGDGYLVKVTGSIANVLLNSPAVGMIACSSPGTTTYTGNTTACFVFDRVAMVTGTSMSGTTFNVDVDTGWLSGDAICISSTTRTATDCELYPLNANAGASSFTSALYPMFIHSGTSPTQAEIGLLTRNVKIRSTSTSLMTYIYATPFVTFTASWAEFYRMASSTAGKRGIELEYGISSTFPALAKSFTYCSFHDFELYGLFFQTAYGTYNVNLTFSNNVFWYCAQNSGTSTFLFSGVLTVSDWTIDNNLNMRSGGYGFNLTDVGGTFTNNTACAGGAQYGIFLGESGGVLGTFDNNTVHSSAGGLQFGAHGISGVVNNYSGWRNNLNNVGGLYMNGYNPDVTFNNVLLFGNLGANLNLVPSDGGITFNGGTIAADTSFSTTYGFFLGSVGNISLNLNNVDMSGVGSIFAPHTSLDFYLNYSTYVTPNIRANNCKFGAPLVYSTSASYPAPDAMRTTWGPDSYISFERFNQVAGDHRCDMRYGQLRPDSVNYSQAAPSLKLIPAYLLGYKMESAPKRQGILVPVANGGAITASVSYRKSSASADAGQGYGGNQPRLIVRANPALGINSDTVLATAADTTSSTVPTAWEALVTPVLYSVSGSNLVATCTGQANDSGVKAPYSAIKGSGKYYFEITLTSIGVGCVFGVGPISTAYSVLSGAGSGGVGIVNSNGNITVNGTFSGFSLGARSNGDKIGVAIDLDNRLAWFRVAPSGNWNNNASHNPATTTGGVAIPAGSLMVPFACGANSVGVIGTVYTANFGGSAFTGAVPSGFTSGWPVSSYDGTWRTLSGTTAAVTDDGVLEFIVDCDGMGGWVNLDDWVFSGAAATSPGMKNWFNGVPYIGGGGGGGAFFSGSFS